METSPLMWLAIVENLHLCVIAKVVADHERDGISNHRPVGRCHPAEEAQQRRVVRLCGDGLNGTASAASGECLGAIEQVLSRSSSSRSAEKAGIVISSAAKVVSSASKLASSSFSR
eukprot:83494-Prymnesium_polylepis.2